eukprot:SAG11_NODE_2011_length_3925_cov_7.509148_3_plen_83_part_00
MIFTALNPRSRYPCVHGSHRPHVVCTDGWAETVRITTADLDIGEEALEWIVEVNATSVAARRAVVIAAAQHSPQWRATAPAA